jgi:hypothetical protein
MGDRLDTSVDLPIQVTECRGRVVNSLFRIRSSGLLCRVVCWLYTKVSEEHTASIFSPGGVSMFFRNSGAQSKGHVRFKILAGKMTMLFMWVVSVYESTSRHNAKHGQPKGSTAQQLRRTASVATFTSVWTYLFVYLLVREISGSHGDEYSLVGIDRRFRGAYCLHHRPFTPTRLYGSTSQKALIILFICSLFNDAFE